MRTAYVVIALALAVSIPAFSATIYGGQALGTTTILHGGDRELTSLAFSGTTDTFDGADFMHFTDGFLFEPTDLIDPQRLYAWNEGQRGDFGETNNHYFSPDRADDATPYVGEANDPKTATLAEMMGSFGSYKNMSYLIDGETPEVGYYVDLLFNPGFTVSGDASAASLEFSILERGGNSDINIYGILAGGTRNATLDDYAVAPILTPGLFLARNSGETLWQLDSLEVPEPQDIHAWGVSIDESWQNLIGIRIEAPNASDFGGPDILGVGVRDIPEPGTFALFATGAFALVAFRRRRKA